MLSFYSGAGIILYVPCRLTHGQALALSSSAGTSAASLAVAAIQALD